MGVIGTFHFEVRDDGFYQSGGDGIFGRIARPSEFVLITCQNSELQICVAPSPKPPTSGAKRLRLIWRGTDLPREVLEALRSRLLNRKLVIDVERPEGSNQLGANRLARAFKLDVRGIGPVFAVRPDALRDWMPGSIPIRSIVAALDRRGWLIRGADGKSTRQIALPGFARARFFCLKLAAAYGEGGADHDELATREEGIVGETNGDPGEGSMGPPSRFRNGRIRTTIYQPRYRTGMRPPAARNIGPRPGQRVW